MRIVNRQQFLALPPGVVYQKCEPWTDDEQLAIKQETILGCNDWFYSDLTGIGTVEHSGSDQLFERLEAMSAEGKEHPYDVSTSRDGCYDANQLFLIYDTEDVRRLIDQLREALVIKEPPSEQTKTDSERLPG